MAIERIDAFRFEIGHPRDGCNRRCPTRHRSAGCDRAEPAVAEQPVPKVTTTPVVAQETIDYDDYTGRTEASEVVEIRARVFGYLKSIDFKDGDYVKEGQTLFTIEPDEYQAIHEQSLSRDCRLRIHNLAVCRRPIYARRRKDPAPKGPLHAKNTKRFVAAALEAEANSNCGKSRCKSHRCRSELHSAQVAYQRPNRSRRWSPRGRC